MKRLVVLEIGERKGVMGALGTDGAVHSLPTLKERLMKEKKELLQRRYDKFFEIIDKFENSLESKFAAKMKEFPFQELFREQLALDIPYSCEKEKQFIMDYINKVLPAGISNAEKQGIELKVTTNTEVEKKNIHILISYTINLAMTLEDVISNKTYFE